MISWKFTYYAVTGTIPHTGKSIGFPTLEKAVEYAVSRGYKYVCWQDEVYYTSGEFRLKKTGQSKDDLEDKDWMYVN